jgi:hypothetical protein
MNAARTGTKIRRHKEPEIVLLCVFKLFSRRPPFEFVILSEAASLP